jgi:indole-3-glycerol phosphate synthase
MDILSQIIAHKRQEVSLKKANTDLKNLENSIFFNRTCYSLKKAIQAEGSTGIISEFKRKSPSKGVFNANADAQIVTQGYRLAGACALSVLTDTNFFMGYDQDLIQARQVNNIPILRKDFTIDEFQILEAKSIGADAILLIAAVLDKNEIKTLAEFAHSLGLEVLCEVHELEELQKALQPCIDCIGVNNRSLKTFEVSLEASKQLSTKIPDDFIKISESGISQPESILELRNFGFQGFLIGETFMKTPNPASSLADFVKKLAEK